MAVSAIRGDDGFDSAQYVNLLNTYAGRNTVIDGNFDVWLEGTSQTISGYGSDTMWWNIHSPGLVSKTHSRQTFPLGQTEVPGNPKYFSRTEVTVSTPDAINYCQKVQKIENVSTYAGQTITLSFYAKADTTKNIAIELFQDFGTGGTPSAYVAGIGSQLVQLSSVWNRYDITVSIPSIAGKVLGTAGDDSLQIGFFFCAGSSFDVRAAGLGIQLGTFDLSQVQLEKGSRATEFEKKPHGQVLAECQRYFQTSGDGVGSRYIYCGDVTSGGTYYQTIQLSPEMRAKPECTIIGSLGDGFDDDNPISDQANTNNFRVKQTCTITKAGGYYHFLWIADARL